MSKRHPTARIISLGSYLPKRKLSNQDLEKLVDTSDEWIVTRTGMKERRLAEANEFSSDMGAQAALKALHSAGMAAEEIELILTATMTPDYISPSTASLIQAQLKAVNAAAMDMQSACTGFLYALSTAKAYIESGMYRNVLVIAAEKMSAFVDYEDRSTCVLFGDGAAAAIVSSQGEGWGVESICLGSDGSLAELLTIPAGGARNPASLETVSQRQHYLKMQGNEVFKHAVRRMSAACKACLERSGLSESDISWLIPHQANKRIIDAIAKQFNMSEDKVYQTVHKYGNTSASSIGIALDELLQKEKFTEGEHLLLTAFGGGLTWGAAILSKLSK